MSYNIEIKHKIFSDQSHIIIKFYFNQIMEINGNKQYYNLQQSKRKHINVSSTIIFNIHPLYVLLNDIKLLSYNFDIQII